MNQATSLAFILSVVLGAVSAAVTTSLLMQPGSTGPSAAPPGLETSTGTDVQTTVLAQLEELRLELRDLQLGLDALEDRATPEVTSTPPASWVTKEELEGFEEEIRATLTASGEPEPPPARLESEVQEVLSTIRKEEDLEKLKTGHEQSVANLDGRVQRWSDWLKLDRYQSAQLRTILNNKDVADADVLRMREQGVDGRVIDDAHRTNQSRHRAALESFADLLDPDQQQTFQQKFGAVRSRRGKQVGRLTMKATIPITLILAVVLGTLSAVVTTSLLTRPDPAGPDTETSHLEANSSAEMQSTILAQLEELRQACLGLRLGLDALEGRSTQVVRTPASGWVTEEAFEEFKAEVRATLAAAAESAPPPGVLKSEVQAALGSIREKEAAQKAEQLAKKNAATLDRRVASMTKRLQLDTYQENQMRTIFAERDKADAEVYRLWQSGAADQVVGEAKRASHEEYQAAVRRILNPGQLELFQQGRGRKQRD